MEKVYSSSIDSAEIVVGIPSYNEADNIAFVVEQCRLGLLKYFPSYKSVIINVDNNSPDDTRSAFLNAGNSVPKIYISTPPGVKGKGNNFNNLFMESANLGAKVIVVVDADLTSITPEWIRDLATPVLDKGIDFATPLYSRNEYDGTITNSICYPLTYGILGKNVRQPIGGDFAFSGRLGNYFLELSWQKTTRQYGIDIFMSMNSVLGAFKLAQVGLGAKIHKPSAPKLGPMFTQVVGTLFATLLSYRKDWQEIKEVENLPLFGNKELAKPQNLSVDYKALKATSFYEFENSRSILEASLEPENYRRLEKMYTSGKLSIGMDLWTKIVYDLMYAYDTTENNSQLIEAMKSLYFGRAASFYRQTMELDHQGSEELIQRQAKYFFRKRNYLIQKYKHCKAA